MNKPVTEHVRTLIRDCVVNAELTLAETLERFPEHKAWDVRKAYSEVRAEIQRAAVKENGAFLSPVYDKAPLSRKGVDAIQAGWMRPISLKFDTLPPVEPTTDTGSTTYLVISDVHAPDQDPQAMDVMYQIGRSLPLDEVIINGDLFDIASLSRFTPGAEQHLRYVEEREEMLKTAVEIRQNFPDLPIKFIPGNHDVRPINWVNSNATALQGIMTLEQWLGIGDLGFDLIDEGRVVLANGKLVIKHGTSVSGNAGYSVKKEIDKAGTSVIMGHVHRRAVIEVTKMFDEFVGVELGCLCSLKPHYGSKEDAINWQQGFAVVTVFEDDTFEIELVKIRNGTAFFRGQRYLSRVG